MLCWELFEEQDVVYKEFVFFVFVKKCLVVEVGVSFGWYCYVIDEGVILSVDIFGVFVFGGVVLEKFGFIVDNIVVKVKELLG